MLTFRSLTILLLAGASTVLVAAPASAATPNAAAASSANWAGYVANTSSSSSADGFSQVSGSWTQPSVNCSSGSGDSAFWVGLGGSDGQSDALEQTGTEADCDSSGQSDYYAWYELVPSPPVRLNLAINAGDHISSSVSVNGSNVTVTVNDQSTGVSATKTLQSDNPDVSSAEWIAEAPSQCDGSGNCDPLPLANFGTVNFSSASATAGGHTGTISDPQWQAEPVALNGGGYGVGSGNGFQSSLFSGGGSAAATPSSLSSAGDSFSVTWQSSSQSSSAGSSGGSDGGGGAGAGGSSPSGSGGPGAGNGSGYGGNGGQGYGSGGGDPYGYGGGQGYAYGGGDPYGYGGGSGGGAYGYGGGDGSGGYGYGYGSGGSGGYGSGGAYGYGGGSGSYGGY
jgi:Peptidase A4 family